MGSGRTPRPEQSYCFESRGAAATVRTVAAETERLRQSTRDPDRGVTTCRCCESRDVGLIGTQIGRYHVRPFAHHRCRRCGFVFVEPVTDASVYDDAYYRGEGADPLVDYEREYRDYRSTPRLLEYQDLARIAQRFLAAHGLPRRHDSGETPSVRWLDYGCGACGLLRFLTDRGQLRVADRAAPIEPVGFDVGAFTQRIKSDGQLHLLDVAQLEAVPDGHFEVITCIEVIEHIAAPRPVVAQIARLLAPGGLLILTTGNMRSPIARVLRMRFPYLTPEIHVSLFQPKLLSELYRQHGLEPCRVRYDGAIRFRIAKNLGALGERPWIGRLAGIEPVLRLFDWVFGVSAMPCAYKPFG